MYRKLSVVCLAGALLAVSPLTMAVGDEPVDEEWMDEEGTEEGGDVEGGAEDEEDTDDPWDTDWQPEGVDAEPVFDWSAPHAHQVRWAFWGTITIKVTMTSNHADIEVTDSAPGAQTYPLVQVNRHAVSGALSWNMAGMPASKVSGKGCYNGVQVKQLLSSGQALHLLPVGAPFDPMDFIFDCDPHDGEIVPIHHALAPTMQH